MHTGFLYAYSFLIKNLSKEWDPPIKSHQHAVPGGGPSRESGWPWLSVVKVAQDRGNKTAPAL